MGDRTKEIDTLRFDSRLADYNLKNRILTLEEYESYLKSLPEEGEFDQTSVFEEEPPQDEAPKDTGQKSGPSN